MTFDEWAEEVECISYRRHGEVLPCRWVSDDALVAHAEGQSPSEYADFLELRYHDRKKPVYYSRQIA
jgi:hypothetical protein